MRLSSEYDYQGDPTGFLGYAVRGERGLLSDKWYYHVIANGFQQIATFDDFNEASLHATSLAYRSPSAWAMPRQIGLDGIPA